MFTLRAPVTFFQLGWSLNQIHLQHKIDAVYAQSLTEKLLLTFWTRIFGLKMFWMEHLQIERWLLQNPYRWCYIFWSRFVTIITVSKGVSEQLKQLGVRQKNIEVIYNGIDTDEFKPNNRPNHNGLIIGTVARLSVEKDIASVIRAVALLKEQDKEVRYRVAGTGDQMGPLQRLADELGVATQIEFLGFTDQIKQFLQSIDLFVLVSFRRESFGIAAAEAMSMAIPAIVSDTVGLNEVVSDSQTGLIVPVHDPKAIATAITFFLDHPDKRKNMGGVARQRVIDNFSLELMIGKFTALFTK